MATRTVRGFVLLLLGFGCALAVQGQQQPNPTTTEAKEDTSPPPTMSLFQGRPVYRLTDEQIRPPSVVVAPDPLPLKDFRTATVVLWCVVAIDGKAHMIQVAKHDTLEADLKAVENLKQWKFKPAVDKKKNREVDFLMKQEVVWR